MNQLFYKLIFFLLLVLYAEKNAYSQEHLFRIEAGGNIGYINEKGKEIIKPKFHGAGDFSEGLAPARLNGTYGYIDQTGEFVIAPEYDYAYSFKDGIAIVYKDGKSFYINRDGRKSFECSYSRLGFFNEGRAFVRTMSGKEGVVNKNGRLIIDTIYTWIHSFPNGLYIVGEPVYDTVREQARGGYSGVMDSVGDFIVPFGKYKEIRSTDGRYFVAAYPSKPGAAENLPDLYKYDILNAKGKTLFTLDYGDVYLADDIRGDLLRVRLLDTGGKPEEWYRKVYYGFMNLKGERVIDDRRYKNAGEFYHNRLVVQDSANNTWLIDTNGKKITENIFEDIEGEHFKNGFAYAKENGKWGVIDTLGKFVVSPQFQRICPWSVSEDCFFFSKNVGEDNEGLGTELTGICGTNGKIILDAVMQHFDYNGFRNGLIKCKINDSEIYIDKTGNIIWQENPRDTTGTIVLNIDFMRSNMDATIGFDERSGYQGFKSYQTGGLVVHVNPDLEGKTFDGFAGYTCFVANNRNEAVWFNTSMGTLRLIMQAIDKNGEWKDIECFNGSFCGNAYYSIKLNSRHYWQIIVPKYAGSIKTKLRMKLTYIDGKPKSDFDSYADKTLVVYSSEFDGAVNPAQFWRVQFDRLNPNANIPLDE